MLARSSIQWEIPMRLVLKSTDRWGHSTTLFWYAAESATYCQTCELLYSFCRRINLLWLIVKMMTNDYSSFLKVGHMSLGPLYNSSQLQVCGEVL